MSAKLPVKEQAATLTRRRSLAGLVAAVGALLAGCSGDTNYLSSTPFAAAPQAQAGPP